MTEWPFKREDGSYNIYPIYELSTREVTSYLNTYFVGEVNKGISSEPEFYSINTIKVVDLEPGSRMYDKRYNPVSFLVRSEYESFNILDMETLEVKRHWQLCTNYEGQLLYRFTCIIYSLDDGCYRSWFKHKTKKEAFSLRTKLYKWFIDNPIVDTREYEAFCRSLDANLDWDTD